MKTIGLIGGVGPESTLYYYQNIMHAFNTTYADLAYPQLILYSVNMHEIVHFARSEDWPGLAEWLLAKIDALQRAGAEFAAIASNTPHIVFDRLQDVSPMPLLSIVTATCDRVREMGLRRIGLLGTRLTMEHDFYKSPFLANGVEIVVPTEAERELIHEKIFSELELGLVRESTRTAFLAIVERMVQAEGIDSLVLGCTELPLLLTESRFGIPFLNTADIHCQSIIRYCIEP
ncbi:amino acid racemase [candidate division KSB1 bacterium]|nr:amino acid racemase [candidate division KSB1 bacterium]RQW06051.1 MAG: amino acid racemase [candidate division KSB1 bacterium]